ncbi:hypothetical protein HG535_0G02980 [Zygotorulaspora mrakii]|uniref:Nitrogen permease regulator 2 n=1 Tax=Zygotorulaspora mrakii TaxID=42260 RepID=A0A7H9B6R4_ZYGMR|nr:uncharacterized protein HG535_0G02980 [Zygotorulaspora mrakii]QLG74415.1 hypothetical protein HG535_0G02980 [Zygotorulaspora mrakii]
MYDNFKGFVPIHTIFYAVFHPTEGTKVRYEFPPGNLESHNINFDTIKNFIIPKPQLCHKLLTLKYKNYRIVSYPVTINSSYYARNFFSFNFVFVFQYDCETSPYEPAIARLAKMFKVLEEQNQILSKAERDLVFFDFKSTESTGEQEGKISNDKANTKSQRSSFEKYKQIIHELENNVSKFSVRDLVMRVYQDLNNYSECLIPIDDGNAVDIRIFPIRKPPSPGISIEDVPISTVNLNKLIDVNWDPTMLKIVTFIDGLNSISKIAKLSDSDPDLVVECIKHLIYYKCVILSDIFQFGNIYAPTSLLRQFLTDPALASECQSYVYIKEQSNLSSLPFSLSKISDAESGQDESFQKNRNANSRAASESSLGDRHSNTRKSSSLSSGTFAVHRGKQNQGSFSSTNTNRSDIVFDHLPTRSCLFDLYRSLNQGITIKEWYKDHYHIIQSNKIDVRRFIIFGVVKNIIHRCYSFPVFKNLEIFGLFKGLGEKNTDISSSGNATRSAGAQKFTKNIFSSADIKFGAEEGGKYKGNKTQSSQLNIGDEALQNAYKKLSLSGLHESRLTASQPLSRFYRDQSQPSSSDLSIQNFYSIKRSERPSKVSFDMKEDTPNFTRNLASQKEKNRRSELIKSEEEKSDQKLWLLECLKGVENLDRICLRLEKSRSEVEELLRDFGDYKIINS